jgi:hypothetical protein
MKEATWVVSTRPSRMLNELKIRRPASGARRCRLFAVACCRRIWDLLIDRRSRRAVDTLERFAVGASTAQQMARHGDQAQIVPWDHPEITGIHHAAQAVVQAIAWDTSDHRHFDEAERSSPVAGTHLIGRVSGAAYHAAHARGGSLHPEGQGQRWLDAIRAEEFAQADLVREIFGNVCRPIEFDPSWRSMRAVDLARAIEGSRDFEGMPALGDALEEAGCDHAEILDHCRGPAPHVRGCWVLDAVIGRALIPAGNGRTPGSPPSLAISGRLEESAPRARLR